MSKKPLKIYIAGPIQGQYNNKAEYDDLPRAFHEVTRIMHQNVQKATQAAIQVMKFGHIPFLPHLNYYLHINSDTEFPRDYWLQYDNVWLDLCDALLYLAPCNGADVELARAKKKGLAIFYHISEVPNLYTNGIKQDLVKVVHRSDLSKPTSTRLLTPKALEQWPKMVQ